MCLCPIVPIPHQSLCQHCTGLWALSDSEVFPQHLCTSHCAVTPPNSHHLICEGSFEFKNGLICFLAFSFFLLPRVSHAFIMLNLVIKELCRHINLLTLQKACTQTINIF